MITKQELLIGQLNAGFNKIHNCEIQKPPYKKGNTYDTTFFLKKRKGIAAGGTNVEGDIFDKKIVNGREYILTKTLSGSTYVDITLWFKQDNGSYADIFSGNVDSNTPLTISEGKGATGVITTGYTIADGYFTDKNKGSYNSRTTYYTDDIVQYGGLDYQCIQTVVNIVPTNTAYWKLYKNTNSGYQVQDPNTIAYTDIYEGGYLKIKITKTNISSETLLNKYVYFDTSVSNLQGIATKIWYETSIDTNNKWIYIRGTNLAGSRPKIGETFSICTRVEKIPIVCDKSKIYAVSPVFTGVNITSHKITTLYEVLSDDAMVDVCYYNGVLFFMSKTAVFWSRQLTETNINFYPLDYFQNVYGGERIVPFGKMLVLFGDTNAVITPVNGTTGSVGYVYTELNYNNTLWSKYSVLSTMASLYVLQDDKQLVKLDITSVTNIDYDVTTTDVLVNVRGLLENISGDVYMNKYNKVINIMNGNYVYEYNMEYNHWITHQYNCTKIHKIEDRVYGDSIYNRTDSLQDLGTETTQTLEWSVGDTDLYTLKRLEFVKMMFGIPEEILDYTLEIDYEIGGHIYQMQYNLTDYPVNQDIVGFEGGLGDSMFGTSLIGATPTVTTVLGTYVSVTVGVGVTGSLFDIRLKSKNNGYSFGGGFVQFTSKDPTVTEFNYKH